MSEQLRHRPDCDCGGSKVSMKPAAGDVFGDFTVKRVNGPVVHYTWHGRGWRCTLSEWAREEERHTFRKRCRA